MEKIIGYGSVAELAERVLDQLGETSVLKLHKLLYYCQAWSLVWTDRPLFDDAIIAGPSGPMVPQLYRQHRGLFSVKPGFFRVHHNYDTSDEETIASVLDYYGNKKSWWLTGLVKLEDPWRTTPSSDEISHSVMKKYYESLLSMPSQSESSGSSQ